MVHNILVFRCKNENIWIDLELQTNYTAEVTFHDNVGTFILVQLCTYEVINCFVNYVQAQ